MTTEQTTIQNKRIIFVTGDKGGVGKSFVARTLLQYYLDAKLPCQAIDIDPINPSLHQHYPNNTVRLNIAENGALDPIQENLLQHPLILVDCAARALHDLSVWLDDLSINEEQYGWRIAVTFVFVITPDKSCTAIMAQALDMFARGCNYLVIRNTGLGKNFYIYDNSQLRKRLTEEFNGKEIILPPLLDRTALFLGENDLGFRESIFDKRVRLADRSRVHAYLRKSYVQFDTVKEMLTV